MTSSLPRTLSLWWQFTLRQVELRHKGSHLGLVWAVLAPLLQLALYVFVFGMIFGGRFGATPGETTTDYALGIFVGLSAFHFLAEVIASAPLTITSQPNFVKRVVFPLEVLPAASVGSAAVHYLIATVLAAAGIALFGPGLSWQALWWPLIALPLGALALGLGWLLAALGVFLRDLVPVTAFAVTALMFASAVFYPPEKIPPAGWAILRFNPLLHAVELSRDALLWSRPVSWPALGYLYVSAALCCAAGWHVFRRLKPVFADVI